ncbi:hypothetical protein COCOBI_05-1340 [Coccomyxa sp. Obi]|nr:hypothetical protein COCOBI_05-1340 [Coccomyxa sp. Obi]
MTQLTALLNATKMALREQKEALSTDDEDALPRWSVGKRSDPRTMLEARQRRQGRRQPNLREPSSAAPMQRLPQPPAGRAGPQPTVPRPTQMPKVLRRGLVLPIARGRRGQLQRLPCRGPGGLGPPGGGPVSPGAAYSTAPGACPGTPPGGGPEKLCTLSPSVAQPQTGVNRLNPVSRRASTSEGPGSIRPRCTVPVSPMKAKGAAAAAAQTHAGGLVEVPIKCNGNRGRFLLERQSCVCHCKQCTQRAKRMHVPYHEMTPGAFERHSGMAASKKWKDTLRVDKPEAESCPLGAYLDQLSGLTNSSGRSGSGNIIQAAASAVAAGAAKQLLHPANAAAKPRAFQKKSRMSQL